ncbi:DUF6286 domain-containing protein [Corynebacterium frankenforstense]|mgnify:CR=1 FL=1|uniref:DUF6286 domain-containing protein n=1 Tax=Corynebacterium frankenforstense TaxID=1230998 RepID=UPI0026ED8014|nr:DUF6286 domain-containing protein [Corynebacterium frankenforstense]
MAPESTEVRAGAGQEPRATPAARWLAVLLGLALVALGVVAGRELWLRLSDGVSWRSWLDPVLEMVAENRFQPWMTWASIIAVVVGLILIVVAFKPRARTHRRLASTTSLWARPVDIARLTTATAKRTPGVGSASTRVSGKTVTAEVQANSTADGVAESIRSSIESTVGPLLVENAKFRIKVLEPEAPQVSARGTAPAAGRDAVRGEEVTQ